MVSVFPPTRPTLTAPLMLPAHVALPPMLVTSVPVPVEVVTTPPAPGTTPPLLPKVFTYWALPPRSRVEPKFTVNARLGKIVFVPAANFVVPPLRVVAPAL